MKKIQVSKEDYNRLKQKERRIEKIKKAFLMNLGIILLSVGVYFFKIPNGFSTGGVSGISTVLGKLTPISATNWILILNVLLLLFGFLFLGKETGVLTVYCSLMFSFLSRFFEMVCPLLTPITNETFLEFIYAMLLTSIGSAMIFYCNASSGGTDIIALFIKKYLKINSGKALLISDFVIAASSFFVFDIKTGMFSLLGLFSKAFLVDNVIDSLNSCKYFIVITTEYEKVSEYIIKNMHHGVTMNDAVGIYKQENKKMLHTVCKRLEAIKLKQFVKATDPGAFVIITSSSDIIGRGFRSV